MLVIMFNNIVLFAAREVALIVIGFHGLMLNPLKHGCYITYINPQFLPHSERVNWLVLFRKVVCIHRENHTKHMNRLCVQVSVFN